MPTPALLPGIRIDVAPPPPVEVLPRMDIAVFVGFAATGPVHLPVAIESVAHFVEVFGPDAHLAWDAERGERLSAHLGAAVRAFFANGGRRCWVIRVARTPELEALWRGKRADQLSPKDLAIANRFPVPGVLALHAGADALQPAEVQARCVGSWSDNLFVATALSAIGFQLDEWQLLGSPPGSRARFRTPAPLQRGDLIELATGGRRVFARVDSAVAGLDPAVPGLMTEVTLCAAFESLAAISPQAGQGCLAGITSEPVPATLTQLKQDKLAWRLRFDVPIPLGASKGQWARWSSGAKTVWLRVDTLDTKRSKPLSPDLASERFDVSVVGPAWRQLQPTRPIQPPTQASLLTLDLSAQDAVNVDRMASIGLTPAHPRGWWQQIHDDLFYATATPDPTRRFPLAVADAEAGMCAPIAWIPLGATPLDSPACGALPQPSTAFERDGLSRFDAELFLDPELADLGVADVAAQADMIRFLTATPRGLFGLHAALAIGTAGLFNEASLLAVPDASHPGWKHGLDPVPRSVPVEPPAPATKEPSFTDCVRADLAAPVLNGAASRGVFRLSWSQAAPGTVYAVQQSARADFTSLRTLYTGLESNYDAEVDRTGTFFYRVTATLGVAGSVSNTVTNTERDDDWIAVPLTKLPAAQEKELLRVHGALLRLCAATGELFAALSLPRHYRTADAVRYAALLRGRVRTAEQRALSYGALYHPWPVCGTDQRVSPADGAVIGVLAARAAARGAWIAPANVPLRQVVALTPTIDPGSWLALQQAAVNTLRDDPRGFLVLSAATLSEEPGFASINVRRLFILLRRLALRRGANYVFEPNGDALRRAVERGFTILLGDLFRRGAFAGATPAESFAVVTGEGVATETDRNAGRFIVELRVAPAFPLQFLALRLVQSGDSLTVTEGA